MPLQDGRRSKSIEEREEEYQRVRDRIFAREVSIEPGQGNKHWEGQINIKSKLIYQSVAATSSSFDFSVFVRKVNIQNSSVKYIF